MYLIKFNQHLIPCKISIQTASTIQYYYRLVNTSFQGKVTRFKVTEVFMNTNQKFSSLQKTSCYLKFIHLRIFSPVINTNLAVSVNASLHPINVQKIKGMLQGGAHQGQTLRLQVLQLVHKSGMTLFPSSLKVRLCSH